MSKGGDSGPVYPRCPHCGNELVRADQPVCPACGRATAEPPRPPRERVAAPVDPYAAPSSASEPPFYIGPDPKDRNPYAAPRSMSDEGASLMRISTLMLLIGVVAILLAAFVGDINVGFSSLLVLVPAVGRTLYISSRSSRSLGLGELVVHFLYSLLVAWVTMVAAGIAFFATCFPLGLMSMGAGGNGGVVLAFGTGFIAAAWTAWVLGRRLFRVRNLP